MSTPNNRPSDDDLDFTLDNIEELNPDPGNDTETFFSIIHPAGYHRFTQDLAADWPKSYWSRTDEPLRMPPGTGKEQIFVSVNPICQRITADDLANPKFTGKAISWIAERVASKNRTVAALTTLLRDYDAKDFTDPTPLEIEAAYQALCADPKNAQSPEKALRNQAFGNAKSAKFKTNPAHYKALALAHVEALTPVPSVIVASGGGYNCYWLLDEPLAIRTDEHDPNNHITSYAADIQKRWVHMDARADQGVNDIRRIFRPVGTTNHKDAYAPNFPTVAFVKKDFAIRYKLVDLAQLLPKVAAHPEGTRVTIPTARTTAQSRAQARLEAGAPVGARYEGDSVIYAYNAAHRIVDVLLANGYTQHGDRLLRPGGDGQPGVDIDTADNKSRHWSHNDAMYSVFWRRPFDVFKEYEHGGNLNRAVAAAAAELGMVKAPVASDKQWIQAAREWLQSANFAEWIPVSFHGSRGYGTLNADKFLYSAFLDAFAGKGYTKLRGPVSNQQLSLASGLSSGSVRRALQRLLAAGLIRKIDAPEDADSSGAFWYELVIHEAIVSCARGAVVDVVRAELHRATYATETFTTHKADDPYQRSGTKRQRAVATVKQPGPGGLLLIDALHDYGPMPHQQIGAITKQSKFTISRLVRHLEALEIVTVEKKWRERVVTLAPDWEATVKRLTPKMPTFGNKFRRTLNAHLNTVDHCDRQVARGMGDREKLEHRRERAATAAFELQAQELAEHFTSARQREALGRLHIHDAQSRAAAGLHKNAHTLPMVEQMARKEAPKWFAPYSQEDNRRLVEMMQTLHDNEDLAYARQQMRDQDAGIYIPPTQATYAQAAMMNQ